MRESKTGKLERAYKMTKILYQTYPDSRCSLNYKSAHELLVATILSAQCTDHRVNIVTIDLFKKYIKPEDFSFCDVNVLSIDIQSCGYHNQKAKSIQETPGQWEIFNSWVNLSGRRIMASAGEEVRRRTTLWSCIQIFWS